MRKYIFIVLLVNAFGCTAFGQTIVQSKKADKEQHALNRRRERLDKKEKNLDGKERVVRRDQRRLNNDQKGIDKQRPDNNLRKTK